MSRLPGETTESNEKGKESPSGMEHGPVSNISHCQVGAYSEGTRLFVKHTALFEIDLAAVNMNYQARRVGFDSAFANPPEVLLAEV